jgi:hypothetical protein
MSERNATLTSPIRELIQALGLSHSLNHHAQTA